MSQRRHRVRETLATASVALLAFAVGVVLFNNVLMPRIVHRAGEVIVPDLENLTVEQAQAALAPTGLALSRAGERFDPGVERGRIVAQDPAAGTPVRGRRRTIAIVSAWTTSSVLI